MPERLSRALHAEFEAAERALARRDPGTLEPTPGDLATAFRHLERAHVLGQGFVVPHVKSHLGMLHVGWLRRDRKEIVGQLLRLPAAAIGSLLGHVPIGNTGGARVPAFRSMPIPDDLAEILGRR